jgi:hypothetical protein
MCWCRNWSSRPHKVQFRIMTVLNQLPQRLAAGERGEMAIAELAGID